MSQTSTVQIGDIKMSYLMQPCGLDGRPINGGNHYADADTIDAARDYANRMLGLDDTSIEYRLGSVEIVGREMRFTGKCWSPVPGGRFEREVIRRNRPVPLSAADLAKTCYPTTIRDFYELVHERREDGSCKCGHHPSNY